MGVVIGRKKLMSCSNDLYLAQDSNFISVLFFLSFLIVVHIYKTSNLPF